ncbi:MAG: hypothetical protein J7M19_02700 [Planctomycetes bacterium]|nr:hypothetical protein [Planctomycetota bacterium]
MSDLITTERAREIPALANADAAYLASLVAAASAAVESYCKRTFAETAYTAEYHDGGGEDRMFLDNFPVTALSAVWIIETGGGEVEISGEMFDVDASTGEICFKSAAATAYHHFPAGFHNVKAAYTAGFAAIPQPVQEATAELAAWLWANASPEGGVTGEKLGNYSRSFEPTGRMELPAVVRRLLAPYRNVRV